MTVVMDGVRCRVAFQGARGAYSEDAVRRFFGPRAEPEPSFGCDDVVRAVGRGGAAYGLLPVENSLAGSVVATYDALLAEPRVYIVGETVLPIHHCVLAPRGARLDAITVVESHPVALAQCRRWLAAHPEIVVRAAYDTAGAAEDVARCGDPARAAIAGRGAAARFGLAVLATDVEDRPDNVTRFVAIARAPSLPPEGCPAKTALIATTPNVPGALHRLLGPIAAAGLNLTKLESRPAGEPWRYRFILELAHTMDHELLATLLGALGAETESLRVMGTFAAEPPEHASWPGAPA
jgi:prephenate dehydratase